MDFEMTCLDGFVGSESDFLSQVSDAETRQNEYGSGFLKHGRSNEAAEEDWNNLKFARTDDLSSSRTMLLQQSNPSLFGSNSVFLDGQQQQQQHQHQQQQQQMLSFSSPNSDVMSLNQNSTLPYHPQELPTYTRNTGLGSGSLNTSLHGILTRTRGPFTPSQWLELEQQALIYKYLTAKVPIPSNLLINIRKPLNPSGSSHFAGPFRPNPYGWSSLHLGFSANTDPEPGRCRRTDGKKWRCSRDIVPDQKYCERHMNRSRHRSRKPVDGQGGYAVSATTNKRVTSIASSSARMASSGGPSSNLAISQHQVRSLQSNVTDPSLNFNTSSILLNQENVSGELQDSQGLSMLRPDMNAKSKDAPISILKQHNRFGQSSTMNLQSQDTQFSVPEEHNPFEQSSRTEFGLISTDPLMNASNGNSYIGYLNFGSSPSLYGPEPQDEEPLYHFIDDWPNNDSSTIPWPEVEETNLDQTKLSISIPMASSEFSSSTCEKLTLSPLRMGFPVDSNMNEPTQRQANWIPISWETSNGGPLGEVLNNTNNIAGDSDNSSALNLMTEGWDTSAQMESSPEGVQQKATSPRAETNKIDDEARLGDNSVGSTRETSSSIPFI